MESISWYRGVAHLAGILAIYLPSFAYAQSRGGPCESAFCNVTGTLVFLGLLGIFLLSVVDSISRHGFWARIIRHPGIQFAALYVAGISGAMVIFFVGLKVGGGNGATVALLVASVILYLISQRKPVGNQTCSKKKQ